MGESSMNLYNLLIIKKRGPIATATTKPERGFTLFELVMVMTIIVILAAVGVASYQKIQLKAKETLLRQNLKELRKLLDQYTADKEAMPQSLEDLVTAGYIREVPIDPVTGETDWILELEEDDVSLEGGQGVGDIRSNAPGEGSDGIPYREY